MMVVAAIAISVAVAGGRVVTDLSGEGWTLDGAALTDGEWVQTAKLWTDSYTVDKAALGSSRIRLTWTWKVPVGTTIIFY